jgi:hypothetical protein
MKDRAMLALLLIVGVLVCWLGHAARAYGDEAPTTELQAADAITALLERPSPLMRERSGEVVEIARACANVEDKWGVPCLLLIAMMHHESRFDHEARGAVGEVGLLQVHGVAAHGCELDTIAGQVDCGAIWLLRAYDHCHEDWFGALTAYAAANQCKPIANSKLDYRISARWHLWQRLQKSIHGEQSPTAP